MKIKSVSALPGHQLQILFDDDIAGIIDLSDFIQPGIFSVLKDEAIFSQVYTNGYSVAWNDELEIDALNIYAELLNKTPKEILNVSYATN